MLSAEPQLNDGHRSYVTRREYSEWVREAAALATALNYPIQPEMINDSTGIVFGDGQYDAFIGGLWSPEPYEVMIIFESLNEPAVDGLPLGAEPYADYGGLCDKLMILHPGKFCPPHYHLRKTETYEVVMGSMDLFYGAEPIDATSVLGHASMPAGEPWPVGVELPAGREDTYSALTSYRRLERGDAKYVMHRRHLHAFRCPPDASLPLVVREVSTYSHEPTAAAAARRAPLKSWEGVHDNTFLSESANRGRLRTLIEP
jgi:hypothetical protein